MTLYPAQIDNDISLPQSIDGVTTINSAVINRLREVILNIEEELGVQPAGLYGTVTNRFAVLENIITAGINVIFNNDLAGTAVAQTVIGIQNHPVSATAPTIGQILEWNGSSYIPTTLLPGFIAGGDLSGSSTAQSVIGLYNHPLANTIPIASAVPVWDTGLAHYDIRQLTLDDLAAGFSISSFTGGSVVEVGATVTNPSFTASYSSLPASAQITNTDGTDSPLTLSTPFSTGTVIGSFHKTSAISVTFTLTAIGTSTKTATQTIAFEARSFGGVGSAGATGTVTAGVNTAILSTTDILGNLGLHSSDIGNTYGPFTASAQKCYLLLIGGSHVLHDPATNTIIPFLTPTSVSFTNQNSSVISMYLYESQFLISTTFSVLVYQ